MRLSFVRVTIGLPLQPDSFTHDWDRQDCDYQSLPHSVSRPSLCPRDAHARPSERLGHSKIGITLDLYSHVLPNMQADAAAVVDDALRAALNKRETKD